MNCSVGTCAEPAEVREPLPLCGTDALRVIAAYAEANLAGGSRTSRFQHADPVEEIGTLFSLLDSEGWNQVDLRRAVQVLNRPETTAARRLAEARKQYAAELNRRAGRSRREVEVEAVLAQIYQAGDPKAVSLEFVKQHFGLKQGAAWDRLSIARTLWTEAQNKA
jgi:hypothetical protein